MSAPPRVTLNLSASRRALYQSLVGDAEPQPRPSPQPDGSAPLSFQQERLWFLNRFQPGIAAYNMPFWLRLTGTCYDLAVEQAITEIVRRHAVLRTTFPEAGGWPVQLVASARPVVLPRIDLSGLSQEACKESIQRLLSEEWAYVFDLARGPLFRCRLAHLRARDHAVLVNMHHIVSDGWSLGIFMREFSELYEAFATGRRSPLPELPISYLEYAREQRVQLSAAELARHIDYWREQLANLPATLQLPFDKPRPSEQTFRGETQFFSIPEQTTTALATLARAAKVTPFMVLLAAWKALLYRYTGQTDIVVGTPIANRNRTDQELLIGFFANTLVLRTSVSNELTFLQLLARVREGTLGAYAHQDLPFEKLVEELKPERQLSHNPLFQVMFALQNSSAAGRKSLQEPPSTGFDEPGRVISSPAKFDMSMFLGETANGLSGELEYCTDLFETRTATRVIEHYLTLLEAIAADPGRCLSDLPLLSASEREKILCEWSGSARKVPTACVRDIFEAQVDRTPDGIAVEMGDRRLTYDALDRDANLLARRLRSAGAEADRPVAICLRRSLESVVAPLAALKAGVPYLPLDPDHPRGRLAFMLEDSATRIIVTQPDLIPLLPEAGYHMMVADSGAQLSDIDNTRLGVLANQGDLAYIIYTSGSTGQPKGVAMAHGPLVNLIAWHRDDPNLGRPMRTLQYASLAFDVSFQEMLTTWCTGGTLVLLDESVRRDMDRLLRYIRDLRIERLFLPPLVLTQLSEQAAFHGTVLDGVREIVTAGEQLVLTPATYRLLENCDECILRNHYGPTETHVATEHVLRGPVRTWPAVPPIGRPTGATRVYILDQDMHLVPAGVVGEIFIGSTVARGYSRAILTGERFVPDPFSQLPGARLYRTGDLARYCHDGTMQFLGRYDRQIKVRGFRVECGEVEAAIKGHPAIRHAAVVAHEVTPNSGNALFAYLVLKPCAELTYSELRQYLEQKLPSYMLPAAITVLDALPLSSNGKLDRTALPVPAELCRPAGQPMTGARNSLEVIIAAIWCEVLKLKEVGVYDNFFELGGHSLLATQVVSRIRDALGVEVPLRRLFERPSTIADLALAAVQYRAKSIDDAEVDRLLEEIEDSTRS